MTNETTTLRIHDRNGAPHLDWSAAPTDVGGMIDKAKIVVRGTATFDTPNRLHEWLLQLPDTNMIGPQFFGHGSYVYQSGDRGTFRTRVSGGFTLGGAVDFKYSGRQTAIVAELTLNPTRTLNHLLARYRPEQLNVPAADFFVRAPDRETLKRGLDGNDNVVSGLSPFAPDRDVYLRDYLVLYEAKLQRLLMEELEAVGPADPLGFDGADVVRRVSATSIGADATRAEHTCGEVRLHWGDTQLSQIECFWERSVRAAVPWVWSFGDRCMGGARDVEISHYPPPGGEAVGRKGAALAVTISHDALGADRREKELVVYAKTCSRVRFEERYHTNLPRSISRNAGRGRDRLSALFREALRDAAARLNWDRLGELMRTAEVADPGDIFELADYVRDATEHTPTAFRPTLTALLLTGGITVGDTEYACPEAVARRLAFLGVVEPLRLVRHQRAQDGQRLRLTLQYEHLRAAFGYGEGAPPVVPQSFWENW